MCLENQTKVDIKEQKGYKVFFEVLEDNNTLTKGLYNIFPITSNFIHKFNNSFNETKNIKGYHYCLNKQECKEIINIANKHVYNINLSTSLNNNIKGKLIIKEIIAYNTYIKGDIIINFPINNNITNCYVCNSFIII